MKAKTIPRPAGNIVVVELVLRIEIPYKVAYTQCPGSLQNDVPRHAGPELEQPMKIGFVLVRCSKEEIVERGRLQACLLHGFMKCRRTQTLVVEMNKQIVDKVGNPLLEDDPDIGPIVL